MTAFRIFLLILFVTVIVYTLPVGIQHGWNIFPVFFGDIALMNWAGQFNLDFLCHLMLSALWLAWRNHFSPLGLLLGFLGLVGGILFLSLYLLIVGIQVKGDMKVLLLGKRRAEQ